MTDPIGTAQERELIEDIAAKLANAQSSVLLGGDNEQKRAAYREFAKIAVRADALQSRIAEVERLEERVMELSDSRAPEIVRAYVAGWASGIGVERPEDLRQDLSDRAHAEAVGHLRAALSQHRKL